MTTNSSSYELEHELRYRLPKSVFVNLLTSPYKPFTIVDRVIIRQLWTYNDGVSRSRIRELVDNSGNTTYTACTKYKLDKDNPLRFSHENPSVIKAYEDYFEKPLSHRAHELLHTDHEAWKMPNEK